MKLTRRKVALLMVGAGATVLAAWTSSLRASQEQAPNRREFSISARDYAFSPDRVEVMQDDLVKLTVESADHAYGFAIDQYKISRRVPAGGKTVIEFRADQVGTFGFYSSMTSDARHSKMRGELIIRRR